MSSIHLVRNPRHAALLAAPIRQRILEALDEPGSASTIAARLKLARQKVAYHVRQLEEHGFLELVREEQRRGCTERFLKRTARYLVASNEVFGRAGLDAHRLQDKFSGEYLVALASRMANEVAQAQAAAERAGARIATLSTEIDVRLRSPQERAAFAEELVDSIARVVAKYHDESQPGGRRYRLVVGAYPVKGKRE
ncbi:MAG TPA: helix-turn-helix domain-containing protein [Usitatibacter sp.]|nr:helix-turn-helix domain-containing protein [Usitatibacter sp.]